MGMEEAFPKKERNPGVERNPRVQSGKEKEVQKLILLHLL
jgi:hypothetical protein